MVDVISRGASGQELAWPGRNRPDSSSRTGFSLSGEIFFSGMKRAPFCDVGAAGEDVGNSAMKISLLQFHELAAPRGEGLHPVFLQPRLTSPPDFVALPIVEVGEEQSPRPLLQLVRPRSADG